jgi:endonuclease-3
LFALADNPYDMSSKKVSDIENIIRPCGLAPRKSKAISDLSAIIMHKHQGRVPANFEDLEALPGVGHKTASVVMSQAFGVPAFPVDTHISQIGSAMGTYVRQKCRADRKGPEKAFSGSYMEQVTLANYFFWS